MGGRNEGIAKTNHNVCRGSCFTMHHLGPGGLNSSMVVVVVMSQVVVWPVLVVDEQSWQSWHCLLCRHRERGWPGVK